MKKTLICIAFLCICCSFFSCSITPSYPESGLWYCDDLAVVIDFNTHDGRLYTADDNFVPIGIHLGYGGEICIFYFDGNQNCEVWLYEGDYTYKGDEFLVYMSYKANPEDPQNGEHIDMNDEKFTFKPISDYTAITK